MKRCFSVAYPLHGGADAGGVHEGEHGFQAAVLLKNQIGFCGIEMEHGGGRGANAHLVLDGAALHGIAIGHAAFIVHVELGHDKQRDAPRARWRIGQTRQDDVHDVVCQVVLACGDVDFGARQGVAAIGLWHGFGGDLREIRAALRFRQAHGARPFARNQLGQILMLLRGRAVAQQGVDATHAQARVHGERPVGRAHHFRLEQIERGGQALTAKFGRKRNALPAAGLKLLVGFFETLGRGHHTLVEVAAFQVARLI